MRGPMQTWARGPMQDLGAPVETSMDSAVKLNKQNNYNPH